MRSAAFLLGVVTVLMIGNSAWSSPSADWKTCFSQAETAIENKDYGYAFYKLRKAWLAVPDKNLAAPPYKEIRQALADAVAISPIANEEKSFRSPDYSMEKIDRRFKQREFHEQADEYSVEYKADGSLAFTLRGMDEPYTPAGPCVNALRNMSPTELKKWQAEAPERERSEKEWYAKRMAKVREQMPVVFKPGTSKYQELLTLCQPLKKGEKKEVIGFDINPFLPLSLKTLPDM